MLHCDKAPTAAAQGTDRALLTSTSDSENFWVDGRSPGRQRSGRPSYQQGGMGATALARRAFSRRQGNEFVPSHP